MMKKISQFINKSFDKKIDGTGLALFRIVYSAILLCEICQLFYFRHLIFDKIPFLEEAEIDFGIPIALWFISVLFVLFGAFTRFFTILNYLIGLILVGSIHTFEYHVFYAYMGINFLLMFMPVSRCLSLDRLFVKLKYSNTTFQYNPSKNVRQFYYYVVPFLGLGIVYLDSVFYKVVTPMWYNGLGSWLPSSIPMMTHTNSSFLLNQEWLIKTVGWLTIVFELIFTFVFFKKKWRWPILVIGLILHVGILIEFPIPWFALTACCIYILIVPVHIWKSVFTRKEDVKSTLTIYYDAECPLCVRTKIAVSHFNAKNKIAFKTVQLDAANSAELSSIDQVTLLNDIHSVDSKGRVFNGIDTYIQILSRIWYFVPLSLLLRFPGIYALAKKIYSYVAKNRTSVRCTDDNCGYNPPNFTEADDFKILQNVTLFDFKRASWKYFLAFACLIQMMLITHSWSFDKIRHELNIKGSKLDNQYMSVTHDIGKVTKIFLGLTVHQVFTDRIHFDNYNHIISVVYQDKNGNEKWLPIIDKNGQPDLYIYGSNWVNWTFRVNGIVVNQKKLSEGIQRYTAFWAHKNNINLNDARFIVKVKKVVAPKKWEKDFLNKQIAKPWIDGGYVQWNNRIFSSSIKNIEEL